GGRVVEIKIVFFRVLPVVALAVGKPERPLFYDRVPSVPQRHGKAELLLFVRDTCQPVFAPTICPGTRMIVCEVVPGVSVVAVVFTHRPPLSFTQIWPPVLPGRLLFSCLFKPGLFSVHDALVLSSPGRLTVCIVDGRELVKLSLSNMLALRRFFAVHIACSHPNNRFLARFPRRSLKRRTKSDTQSAKHQLQIARGECSKYSSGGTDALIYRRSDNSFDR